MLVKILVVFLFGSVCTSMYAPHANNRQHTIQQQSAKHDTLQNTATTCKAHTEKSGCEEPLFSWPITKGRYWISSFYGPRKRPNGTMGFHEGVDLAAFKGTPVMAAAGGEVVQAELVRGYGNMILITHDECYHTRYAHLDSWCVAKGQKVEAGQRIGFVGDTGTVRKKGTDASHLHFEVHKNKKAINPLDFLPKR